MWRRNITWFVVFLTIWLALGAGPLRPRPMRPSPLSEDMFFIRKLESPPKYDIVIAGDSRAMTGISPAAMRHAGSGARILNFGFNEAGFGKGYPEAIAGKLDPKSPNKTIIVGVTPRSLTEVALSHNNYLYFRDMPKRRVWLIKNFGSMFNVVKPYNPNDFLNTFRPNKVGGYLIYYQDGWVASRMIPENPRMCLPELEALFKQDKVSPEIIDTLLSAVRTWTKNGIRVYVFRPPTTTDTVSLENKAGNFDEAAFRKRIEAAGAHWLSFPRGTYRCFDGSHLTDDSAIRLSEDLTRAINLENSRLASRRVRARDGRSARTP